ncbi:MAG: heavy metal translocating P-type ATPase [Lachnospiraceae bacterium]|nr:heavy metal translocating P-type ATPase [Lachnospiraceae bacterium]
MKKEKYDVTGMTCSACSSRVEKSVSKLEGVNEASVNLLTNSMQVQYQEDKLTQGEIIEAVEKAGYGARSAGKSSAEQGGTGNSSAMNMSNKEGANGKNKQAQKEFQDMKTRLLWSFIFLIPMMYVSMHHMLYEFFGIPVPAIVKYLFHGNENAVVFSFTQFLLLLPIMYLNQKYYKNGFRNLLHGSPNMDSLIAIGSGAACVYGVFAIFRIGYGLGHGNMDLVSQYSMDLYFESAGMIVTLITLGKFLESKSKGKTSAAIEKLIDLAPKQASVERDGVEIIIPVEELAVGDIILIRPGESVAADGVIIEGTTSIDEAAITGESIPVEKQAGDKVVSATINKTGFIKARAEKVGEDTTIQQIIQLVEEASASKAPIAKMADKISGIFVPTVMVIALLAAIVWVLVGASFEFALSIGIAILVISCPCALGLATPVAIMVGTGKGAENGILIKSGEALETAHNIDTVVMDKTGTITEGKPKVTNIISYHMEESAFMKIAAGMEKGSEHPLAEAIMEYAREKGIEAVQMEDFKALFGRGIRAVYGGDTYYAGNEALMLEHGISVEKGKNTLNQLADEGKTPLIFARNEELLGIIAVADSEKETSKEAIYLFEKMGINVIMLTGDHERTAKAIQKRLHIPQVIAEVMPEDKEKHIAALQQAGHRVAMIGDGINDAPALARADVGIAIGAGTDVAIESADAVLMRNDLLDAVSAIRLSKAVIRNIKQNLFWAFFYNSIGIPLAAGLLYPVFGVKLSPMFGAAAMSLSSVCVVLNALRLRFFQPNHGSSKMSEKEEDNQMERTIKIEGMMCEHCKKRVEDALNALEGVTKAEVNLEAKTATVSMEKEISTEVLETAVTDAGYQFVRD